MGSTINLEAYFQRIGVTLQATPNYGTLCTLHELHTRTIPFENLNPLLGLPVNLDPESLQQKMIIERRGGYCFEQNGYFLRVLEMIGFDVTPLAGRVLWGQEEDRLTSRTHMLLLVHLNEGDYISDVGFGGQVPTAPMQLIPGEIQQTSHEPYRIEYKEDHYLMKAYIADEWKILYRFTLDPVPPIDYKVANWYTSTHPDSHFVKDLTVARVDTGCRYVLHNNQFTIHHANSKSKHQILTSAYEIREVLEKVMQLRLPESKNLQVVLQRIVEERD